MSYDSCKIIVLLREGWRRKILYIPINGQAGITIEIPQLQDAPDLHVNGPTIPDKTTSGFFIILKF